MTNRAFTLVELMVASFILLLGICGALTLFTNVMATSKDSWDTTAAVTAAESVLEEMQNRRTLSDIIATDWDAWAEDRKLKVLPGQALEVSYGEPFTNPLDIQVKVYWQKQTGIKEVALYTKLAR